MIEATVRPRMTAQRRPRKRIASNSNVIPLHQRIMPRHMALLAQWLEAGRRMGLCDASTYSPEPAAPGRAPEDYVLIWVRENIDPAYMIRPSRLGWLVIDAIRQQTLAQTHSFAAALHLIRPVLPADVAAA